MSRKSGQAKTGTLGDTRITERFAVIFQSFGQSDIRCDRFDAKVREYISHTQVIFSKFLNSDPCVHGALPQKVRDSFIFITTFGAFFGVSQLHHMKSMIDPSTARD